MSVDTRTPRPGFDDQPALSMVKVDSDPAQVIVNHASFRVRLAPAKAPTFAANPRVAALSGAGAGAPRRRPVVWTGKSAPGATGLLQAVRESSVSTLDRAVGHGGLGGPDGHSGLDEGVTQAIPRVDDTMPTPMVPAEAAGPLLPPMRRAEGAYDDVYQLRPEAPGPYEDDTADGRTGRRAAHDPVRHAYYPGRRMNLGVVLLPLRVFLGFISIYAGMGKLCDPVYFDGGERGSMVKWLNSLHPWALAEPLRDFALQHPVGAGLTVAFLQVVVGVLTVLGLWQRTAAVVGALLSAALILTVSWRTVPVYDSADIIYLAAWSPLIIAGAPVYSLDGRLASEAWRTLGPRAELWALRRRVTRRSTLLASVVVGLTLLIGSVLGGAVRSTEMVTVPGPNDDPINHLPGRPLTSEAPRRTPSQSASTAPEPTATSEAPAASEETEEATRPTETTRESTRTREQSPTATEDGSTGSSATTTTSRPPAESKPAPPPTTSDTPTTTGGTSSGGSTGSTGSTGGSTPTESGSTSGGAQNPIGGLLG
ncbi:DoxX family membrane protein [Streptomyces sp. NBC_00094]|uniref:DoxX family membrane protein n=1 Tax=Streptomyces sp. NBC_00094 TaxID=2903620 RepID=UPI002256A662|nr:DoxX family membrane protein [Streptomyces sp. NBC_00094]MCX5392201.1 DoxX family membrane protein [Streptomyces sp. NBC_00094]